MAVRQRRPCHHLHRLEKPDLIYSLENGEGLIIGGRPSPAIRPLKASSDTFHGEGVDPKIRPSPKMLFVQKEELGFHPLDAGVGDLAAAGAFGEVGLGFLVPAQGRLEVLL